MRISAKTSFVMFQFTGECSGRVTFQPGPTKAARSHFIGLINRLDSVLAKEYWGGNVVRGGSSSVPKSKIDFVAYRSADGRVETWSGMQIEALSDICQSFGDWLAGDIDA